MISRRTLLIVFGAIALIVLNFFVIQYERLKANGEIVLLEVRPVDPRSLIQGDFMALDYAIEQDIRDVTDLRYGVVVIELDENRVGSVVRVYEGTTELKENERLLRFYQHFDGVSVGPESYFFQEGQAELFEDAAYLEMTVSPAGDALLTGLRGENFEVLGAE